MSTNDLLASILRKLEAHFDKDADVCDDGYDDVKPNTAMHRSISIRGYLEGRTTRTMLACSLECMADEMDADDPMRNEVVKALAIVNTPTSEMVAWILNNRSTEAHARRIIVDTFARHIGAGTLTERFTHHLYTLAGMEIHRYVALGAVATGGVDWPAVARHIDETGVVVPGVERVR